jgi:F-type H+-transporting ATPase subunit delta
MLSVVATRYAKALVDVVAAPASGVDPAAVAGQLRSIAAIIGEEGDLHNVLLSPAVPPSRKRAVLARLLAPLGLYRQVLNFLFVVIDHRRVHEMPSIVEAYEGLLDERLGFVRADVVSAHALGDTQQTSLEAEISRLAGKKAKLKFSTDPALLAGVVARIGSTVYDGSVRGQLDRLRTKLAQA